MRIKEKVPRPYGTSSRYLIQYLLRGARSVRRGRYLIPSRMRRSQLLLHLCAPREMVDGQHLRTTTSHKRAAVPRRARIYRRWGDGFAFRARSLRFEDYGARPATRPLSAASRAACPCASPARACCSSSRVPRRSASSCSFAWEEDWRAACAARRDATSSCSAYTTQSELLRERVPLLRRRE